jgi:hypothetical protein
VCGSGAVGVWQWCSGCVIMVQWVCGSGAVGVGRNVEQCTAYDIYWIRKGHEEVSEREGAGTTTECSMMVGSVRGFILVIYSIQCMPIPTNCYE